MSVELRYEVPSAKCGISNALLRSRKQRLLIDNLLTVRRYRVSRFRKRSALQRFSTRRVEVYIDIEPELLYLRCHRSADANIQLNALRTLIRRWAMQENTPSLINIHLLLSPMMQDHNHRGTFVCPATGATHGFCPAIQGQDSRSVCPALNTMANHGYIRRDGQHITINQVVDGLVHCYCLSYPLAVFLAIGGYLMIIWGDIRWAAQETRNARPANSSDSHPTKLIWSAMAASLYFIVSLPILFFKPLLCGMPLHAFGVHGGVEHNASLVHLDAPPHQKYPPTSIQDNLVDALFPSSEKILTAEKVALQRIRRESELQQPLDPVHAEIARGEMAIMLGVWCLPKSLTGDEEGAPLPYFRDFLQKECLPSGWVPDHVQGLFDVMRISKEIRSAMENIRRSRQEA